MHAIALVNLAEIAGNVAISYTLPGDARFIVAGITIDYVKKARGTLRAVDGAVRDGDTLVLAHGWALHARAFAESPVDWTPAPVSANVRVDLNRASAAELEGLPGIGPALAQRIVAARPFRTVEALDAVKGIGPKRLAALRDRVVVAK